MSSLVLLSVAVPNIVIDLRYATPNNLVGYPIYHAAICYVHSDVVIRLQAVQAELASVGLGLKMLDAYRSPSAQQILWDIFQDERYVTNPKMGGRHTRGTAVDVTLIDAKGNELEMPSAYDEFTERSHLSYQEGSQEALSHRAILQNVMTKHGFESFATEWWHFDLSGWQSYPVLDLEI